MCGNASTAFNSLSAVNFAIIRRVGYISSKKVSGSFSTRSLFIRFSIMMMMLRSIIVSICRPMPAKHLPPKTLKLRSSYLSLDGSTRATVAVRLVCPALMIPFSSSLSLKYRSTSSRIRVGLHCSIKRKRAAGVIFAQTKLRKLNA